MLLAALALPGAAGADEGYSGTFAARTDNTFWPAHANSECERSIGILEVEDCLLEAFWKWRCFNSTSTLFPSRVCSYQIIERVDEVPERAHPFSISKPSVGVEFGRQGR